MFNIAFKYGVGTIENLNNCAKIILGQEVLFLFVEELKL